MSIILIVSLRNIGISVLVFAIGQKEALCSIWSEEGA